jgi:predicted dehydrogenase
MNNALVIGFGSIGARHARLLEQLDLNVAVLSRRAVEHSTVYSTLDIALSEHQPDLVVVASKTSDHLSDINALIAADYRGTALVEKPLFARHVPLPANDFNRAYVAFNLRFHPVIEAFRKAISGRRIFALHAYAGQYLPDWRPGSDYRDGYSAHAHLGGGVLRDLCHELDLIRLFGGAPKSITALGGKVSDLEIDSEDAFSILMELQDCPLASVTVSYLDSQLRRTLIAHTDRGTLCADLAAMTLTDRDITQDIPSDRDVAYRAQLMAVINGEQDSLCSLERGLEINAMIDHAERASDERKWIAA